MIGHCRLTMTAIALVSLVTGCGEKPARWNDPRADAGDAARVALGERLYAQQCASCHGSNLEGQPNWRSRLPNGRLPAPPHDISGHSWHHPDQVLFEITRQGMAAYAPADYESDMPAFAGVLTDEEIAAVIAFIKSRWPVEIRAAQAEMTRDAERR